MICTPTPNERGERIPKYRMTHDQSFPEPSGHSVNSRAIKESLPPCMYSFVLSRTIHYMVNLHRRHLSTRIFFCKFDLDAAYKRCHLSAATAADSTGTENFALDAVNILLAENADPNIQSVNGCTPLHFAAMLGRGDILKVLIENKGGKCSKFKFFTEGIHSFDYL